MTTEETPRLPDRLVMSRLDSFGGINRVAAEFQAATCLEERCNWFCIMLDYVSATQVAHIPAARLHRVETEVLEVAHTPHFALFLA